MKFQFENCIKQLSIYLFFRKLLSNKKTFLKMKQIINMFLENMTKMNSLI